MAAKIAGCDPIIGEVRLSELAAAAISPMATLYVPPAEERDPDRELAARFGIPVGDGP